MQAVKSAHFFCFCLLIALCATPAQMLASTDKPDKLSIFVSVVPQQLFVERIGGDKVDVGVMVKPGFSPATYEPSPRQIAALARAALYIRIGVPFEEAWLPRIQSVNPDMLLVDARDDIELLEMAEHHHSHEHNKHKRRPTSRNTVADAAEDKASGVSNELHVESDPHLWTSPRLVVKMADQIRQQLSRLKPEHSELFAANHAELVAELHALDEELEALFAEHDTKTFMVFHPSWGYFAAAYGLTQVAIEDEGKEPGARALLALIKQARRDKVKTIFVQPQFDQRAARQVAKAIDGSVVAIDALDKDYFANMRTVARLIAGVDGD